MSVTVFGALVCLTCVVAGPRILTPTIDCTQLQQSIPDRTAWIPTCNPTTNQLAPLQTASNGQRFCVDIFRGETLIPMTNGALSCDCVTAANEIRSKERKPMFVPQCDEKTGAYLDKQCTRKGDCWCVDKSGRQLGPRWGAKDRQVVMDINDPHRPQYRPSCDIVTKHWNSLILP